MQVTCRAPFTARAAGRSARAPSPAGSGNGASGVSPEVTAASELAPAGVEKALAAHCRDEAGFRYPLARCADPVELCTSPAQTVQLRAGSGPKHTSTGVARAEV